LSVSLYIFVPLYCELKYATHENVPHLPKLLREERDGGMEEEGLGVVYKRIGGDGGWDQAHLTVCDNLT